MNDVDELKQRLIDVFDERGHSVLQNSIDDWCKRQIYYITSMSSCLHQTRTLSAFSVLLLILWMLEAVWHYCVKCVRNSGRVATRLRCGRKHDKSKLLVKMAVYSPDDVALTMAAKYFSCSRFTDIRPSLTEHKIKHRTTVSHNNIIYMIQGYKHHHRHHFWDAQLGACSAKRRHQSPEWMILSHVNCFIHGEVVGFQVVLDSFHPCSTRVSWWSPPVIQSGSC